MTYDPIYTKDGVLREPGDRALVLTEGSAAEAALNAAAPTAMGVVEYLSEFMTLLVYLVMTSNGSSPEIEAFLDAEIKTFNVHYSAVVDLKTAIIHNVSIDRRFDDKFKEDLHKYNALLEEIRPYIDRLNAKRKFTGVLNAIEAKKFVNTFHVFIDKLRIDADSAMAALGKLDKLAKAFKADYAKFYESGKAPHIDKKFVKLNSVYIEDPRYEDTLSSVKAFLKKVEDGEIKQPLYSAAKAA